jgi:IMP dehydrogenase
MARIIGKGYSYDDVLILPKYNKVLSRKNVSFKTKVTKNYSIDIPFLAANMDSVCEAEMAIVLGKMGGLGILHRFVSVKEQVEMVKEVRSHKLLCAAAIGIKDLNDDEIY